MSKAESNDMGMKGTLYLPALANCTRKVWTIVLSST